jgi:hypothetical protein
MTEMREAFKDGFGREIVNKKTQSWKIWRYR